MGTSSLFGRPDVLVQPRMDSSLSSGRSCAVGCPAGRVGIPDEPWAAPDAGRARRKGAAFRPGFVDGGARGWVRVPDPDRARTL